MPPMTPANRFEFGIDKTVCEARETLKAREVIGRLIDMLEGVKVPGTYCVSNLKARKKEY